MMEHFMISVVVPVFNEEKNLAELIRRCLEACHSLGLPFELILVDDGSRDGSAQLISEAAEHYGDEVSAFSLTATTANTAPSWRAFPAPEVTLWLPSMGTCKIPRRRSLFS